MIICELDSLKCSPQSSEEFKAESVFRRQEEEYRGFGFYLSETVSFV